MTELPAGRITAGDVYRKRDTMSASVIRIEERIQVLPDYESRLRALERFRYTLMGAATLAGTAAGVVSGWLSAGVHH